MRKLFWVINFFLVIIPNVASAHAFGEKYTLPLPAWLYIYGGGATILVSFFLIALFTAETSPKWLKASVDLSRWKFFRFWITDQVVMIFKLLALALLVLTILAGLLGDQSPVTNFAPVFFWIIFLLGTTYLVALFSDFWQSVNPFKTITDLVSKFGTLLKYPKQLGYAPALLFYFVIIYLELLSNGSAVIPKQLAIYLLIYTSLTILGGLTFGRDWFYYGDFFSVFFRLIGKLSPFIYREGRLYLRWPLVGLLETKAEKLSLLLFIIFMLSSTAFDGFRETVAANNFIDFSIIPDYQTRQILMLVLIFLDFLAVYLLSIWLMKLIVKTKASFTDLVLDFAFSLIPIALVYNIAHYYTLLFVQGQSIIGIISDPFNLGWNLFGTNDYLINPVIVSIKTVWNSQVFFILIGHISAVYVAHLIALRHFKSSKQAVLSQIPLLLVMVVYTMTGLWILSRPLIA